MANHNEEEDEGDAEKKVNAPCLRVSSGKGLMVLAEHFCAVLVGGSVSPSLALCVV